MVVSSAFVLTALTMTGLYMKGQEAKQQNDGYTLDFSALGDGADQKLDAIGEQQAKNNQTNTNNQAVIGGKNAGGNLENDLDYLPMEDSPAAQAGSSLVEIPGLTDGTVENKNRREEQPDNGAAEGAEENGALQTEVELHYSEDQGLTRPVNGEVLLPYSMDGSIYFATLDQYKYNPATLFSAEVGNDVYACAEAKVADVFETAELGRGVTLELGNGYTVTYGQLNDISVEEGSYVQAGEKLGTVAAPSRYYVQEGTNLYFCMKKGDKPVNAENLF